MIHANKKHSKPSGLRTTRVQLGLTQQKLAEELEVSRSTIEHVENNIRSLPTSALLKLAMLQMKQQDMEMEDKTRAESAVVHHAMAKGKRTCSAMLIQEASCRIKSRKLRMSLENMVLEYERTVNWLKSCEAFSESAMLNRQKEAAMKRLSRCGIPAQGLLRHEIYLLDGQAELYSCMQRDVEAELKIHFSGNDS